MLKNLKWSWRDGELLLTATQTRCLWCSSQGSASGGDAKAQWRVLVTPLMLKSSVKHRHTGVHSHIAFGPYWQLCTAAFLHQETQSPGLEFAPPPLSEIHSHGLAPCPLYGLSFSGLMFLSSLWGPHPYLLTFLKVYALQGSPLLLGKSVPMIQLDLSPPGFKSLNLQPSRSVESFRAAVLSQPFCTANTPFSVVTVRRESVCMRGRYKHTHRVILLKYLCCWNYSPLIALHSGHTASELVCTDEAPPCTGHSPCDTEVSGSPSK